MSEKPCGAYFFAFFENFFVPISTSGGYVGLSIATLLSQHHQVTAVDIVPEKVDLINNRKSPIQDDYIEKYLAEKELNLTATLDAKAAYADADFVVIAAPTNVYSKESVAIVLSVGAVLSEGFFVQNAEKNLRYKEEPILIFTTRTRLRLVVDLQENVRAQENLAYALKVKISNLQKMAETLVWVQEPFPYSTADVCFAAGPHDPFAEERLGMLFDLEEAIMFTPKPQEYTDPLTGEMKKKQMKFFPDAYKNRIGKSYNDYIADHQMNMFEDFIGYQGSAVLDEPEREAGTTSIPIPQREESENIPLPDLPGQLENVQQSGNEIAERGMPT